MTFKKGLAIGLVAVLVGGGAAGWFLGVPALRELIVKNIVREMERSFSVNAKIGGVGLSSARSAYIKDVALTGKEDGVPVLSAKEINATVSILSLFQGKIAINGIFCDSPNLNFVRLADGTTNLDTLLGRKKGETAHPMTVKMIDAKLMYVDYYKKPNAKPVFIYVKEAAFRIRPGRPVGIRVDGAKYGKSVFSVNGYMGTSDGDQVRLRILSDIFRASEIKNLLISVSGVKVPEIKQFEVPLAIRIDIRGGRGSEKVFVNASASDGLIGKQKVASLRLRCSGSRERLTLDKLDIRLEGGGHISGRVRYEIAGEKNIDMFFNSGDFPVDVVSDVVKNWNPGVTGSLDAQGRLRGNPSKRETLEGKCSFTAKNGKIAGVMDGSPLEYDTIEGDFNVGGGSLSLQKLLLKSKEMDLSLGGRAGLDGALDFNGRAEVEKGKVRTGGMRKLISKLLPDGQKGYIFKMHVGGTFGAPKIEFSAADTLRRGVVDNVRDSGNRVEHFIKKIF
jgi:hypothetical protein